MFRLKKGLVKFHVLLIVTLLSATSLTARTIQVKASGIAFAKALAKSRRGDTLELAPGFYRGKFTIPPRVSVVSKQLHKAVINANGRNRTITMMNGSTIHGVAITGGQVGVYSEGIDNKITGCKIYNNRQSGIVAVATLPEIRDNIIFRNSGSGITVWEIAADTIPISHNTVVFNGNHGITVGGKSEVEIVDNIIAFNHKMTIQATEEAKIFQHNNNYYFNVEINMRLPEGNYSFDPLFSDPGSNDFSLSKNSRCIGYGTHGSTIGSEIFANNNQWRQQ